jgi:hypothetical protein
MVSKRDLTETPPVHEVGRRSLKHLSGIYSLEYQHLTSNTNKTTIIISLTYYYPSIRSMRSLQICWGEGDHDGHEGLRPAILLLTTYDVAVDKFDFTPVQSPDMRLSRCKKILVQGDEPQKLSVKFLFWGQRGNFGVKNKKMKTKIGLLLTLF